MATGLQSHHCQITPHKIVNPPPPKTLKVRIAHHTDNAKNVLKVSFKITALFRSICSFIEYFDKISWGLSLGIKGSKLPKILKLPFTAKKLAKDIFTIVRKRTSIKNRLLCGAAAVVHANSVMSAVSTITHFLVALNVVAKTATCWLASLGIVGYAVSFVSLGRSIEKAHDASFFQRQFGPLLASLQGKPTAIKAKMLAPALYEIGEKIDHLRKKLLLGKYVYQDKSERETLQDHAQTLSKRLLTDSQDLSRDVAESERFLKLLVGRAKQNFGFSLLKVSMKVISVVAGTLCFIPAPPAEIAALVLCAIPGAVTIVSSGGRSLFTNRHPLDPQGMCPMKRLQTVAVRTVRHAREHIRMDMKRVFLRHTCVHSLQLEKG